jgi:hypothetical protein
MQKDVAVVDLATGLPFSRTFVRHQDSIHSQNVFFSWKQWEVSLRSLQMAPRPR